MKLLGLDVRRHAAKAPVETTKEVGRSGTIVYGGQLRDEYLSTLQGRAAAEIYDQMRRSDAQVMMMLRAISLPILRSEWTVKPSEDDPKRGEEIAAMVKKNLVDGVGMSRPWSQVLHEALLCLPFGFSPMEKVYGLDRKRRVVNLRKLALRHPRTVNAWRGLDRGELEGIEQWLWNAQGLPTSNPFIPIEKLCVFINQREGDNWEGISILRPCYKHWWVKETLEKIDAAGHERMSIGIPVAKLDGTVGNPDEQAETWAEILSNLQAMERNYIIEMPGTTFRFEVVGKTGSASGSPLLQSINYHARMIAVAGLVQFMELGNTQSGSRAVASEQSGPFDLELMAIQQNLCETFNSFVIPELVTYNFGEREGYPQLEAGGISETDTAGLATFLSSLIKVKAITPDDELEKYLRNAAKLPGPDVATTRKPAAPTNPFQPEGPTPPEGEPSLGPDGQPLEPSGGPTGVPAEGTPPEGGWPTESEVKAWELAFKDTMQPTLFAQDFIEEMKVRGLKRVLVVPPLQGGRDAILMARAGLYVTCLCEGEEAEALLALASEAGAKTFRTLPPTWASFGGINRPLDAVYALEQTTAAFGQYAAAVHRGGIVLVQSYTEEDSVDGTRQVRVTPDEFLLGMKREGLALLDYHSETDAQYDAAGKKRRSLAALAVKA